ncbi:MAG: nicotinate-nucleotide adenylyltransferase [Microthrixaceae bacterium]|nr:nicotinate-nucleotide adenylyltransferase [Microthrixaceae bacterium]
MSGRRVGIMGGTFDPPHIGHLVTAINVRHELGLDEVLMVVANEPWQKVDSRKISLATDRYEMVQAAVVDDEGVEASDIEIRRGGSSYSVDTLEELLANEPGVQLFLVLGADAAAGLDSWERADDLDSLCTIVVVDRPGTTSEPPERFQVVNVEVPRLEVSSTDLRARVRDGRPTTYLLPERVRELIEARELYSCGE